MSDVTFGLSMRQPPSHLDAEQALLGALLANNKAYERVADFLLAEHFADGLHGRIYAAIARRIDAGQVADVVTLSAEFEGETVEMTEAVRDKRTGDALRHETNQRNGRYYLATLLSAMVGIINAGEYGRVIRDAWLRRQVIDAGEAAVNLAFGAEPELSGDNVLERVEGRLFALGEDAKGRGQGDLVDASMVAQQIIAAHDAARQREGGIVGLATGYRSLDRLKGGFRNRDLVYLAGRPGMGKTALAIGIAKGVAAEGGRVYFASAEMDGASVQVRAVAAESGLPAEALERAWIIDPGTNQGRRLTQHEYDRFFEANRKVGALPIVWDVRAAPTVASIRARARREKARHGLAMVIVDHIGLLSPGAEFRDSNRNNELSRISAGLKAMQVELQVPVIALSQLSRKVEEREDKRPMLSDLRDSGSLEQDADAVAFVFREEYYLKKFPPKRRDNETEEKFIARSDSWRWRLTEVAGVGEVILAKHRQGPEGTVRLRWDARLTWFFDDDGSAPPHAGHGGHSPASHGAPTERNSA